MVGHDKKKMRPPKSRVLPETDALEDRSGDFRQSELVVVAFQAVDSDEKELVLWINPEGDCVGQGFRSEGHEGRLDVLLTERQ
jgi:hypothetical protein